MVYDTILCGISPVSIILFINISSGYVCGNKKEASGTWFEEYMACNRQNIDVTVNPCCCLW